MTANTDTKRKIMKRNIILILLALASVGAILLVMPRTDIQSYSYELNQPWKYPLLTAQFDTPIMRDSLTASALQDSIDRVFVPFVKRDNQVAGSGMAQFAKAVQGHASYAELAVLNEGIKTVYTNGIVATSLYDHIHRQGEPRLRMVDRENPSQVIDLDASEMLTPARAFEAIDSMLRARTGAEKMPDAVSNALSIYLNPNILIDTLADNKYRNQEYLNFTGAQGVIKTGQRIVDRGEIITPQIYTNLNTYLDMLQRQHDEDNQDNYYTLGRAIYLCILVVMLYLFMGIYRHRFFVNVRQMSFLMTTITVFALVAIVMFNQLTYGIYIVPFALVPVVVLTFFDARTAIFALLTAVLIGAIVSVEPLEFIFLEITAGLAATYSIHHMSKRSHLLRAAVLSFLTYCLGYFAMTLVLQGDLSTFSFRIIMAFAINSIILSFAYVLIVVFEKVFGFTSMVTLVELSDINNRVLRRLAEEAPGTFQHSMQVSTLAAEAARAIGANSMLVRTGALYHDIGKLDSPIFFTENQHGINPHAGLDPQTSAQKIISHVTSGLSIAAREKLPQVIRDFISEHHGKGITRYFYNTAVNNSPDGVVSKKDFTYPGPNPQSKETTIVMMADAVEAASRSLKDYSPESISNLVDKIIDTQMQEGLYNNSKITFRDIETIKDTFKRRLSTIYHARVAYPELNKPAADVDTEPSNDNNKPEITSV